MNDGSNYYLKQSQARGIGTVQDVKCKAEAEAEVYDNLILPHLPQNKEAAIYEAATGPGILQYWMKSRGFHNLHGSDFSRFEAELAAEINPEITFSDSIKDLEHRFPAGSLNTIVALDFYEHITRENFALFLEVAISRLSPDGKLILRGPNGDSPFVGLNFFNDPTHIWCYTTISLSAILRMIGFSRIEFSDDTIGALHSGRFWKAPIMACTQGLLRIVSRTAIRYDIRYWGPSLYCVARR